MRCTECFEVCYPKLDALEHQRDLLLKVRDAAYGLSKGTDWNNGTHAATHGYRQSLLKAIESYDAAYPTEGK